MRPSLTVRMEFVVTVELLSDRMAFSKTATDGVLSRRLAMVWTLSA